MPLAAGTRLGQYEILSSLGAGGMGEVYRARDRKLGRDVAIKILPEQFINTPERSARFEREAQLLAAVNHPNIGAIYGLEESPSGRFLVLELIEGESLADRIAAAAPNGLPVREALRIAGQIIDALEAAHEKGIIHRDLKPGNIMLTADGQVKVLDFGLARAMESDAAASVSNSPTLSLAATQAGVILGTAAYMSPEQAKGRVADKRSDVWAFGCVLFEMLTGRRAFEGEDVSDTLAAILRGEPDWKAIPPDVPPHVTAILRRCLERDRKARIPDISVVRYLLTDAAAAPAATPQLAQPGASRGRQIAIAIAGVAGGVLLAAGVWFAISRFSAAPRPHPMRFAIVPPPTHALAFNPIDRTVALSPDGFVIVYLGRPAGSGENLLMMRRIDALESTILSGTNGARYPFFSPDGRWIGFFIQGELRKVALSGGTPITICRVNGGMRGATWTASNTIVYATNDPATGLMTVPAAGGEPNRLTKLAGSGEDHFQPSVLPDDRHVLFTVFRTGAPEAAQIAVADLATGEYQTLIRGGSNPEFIEPGFLVFALSGTLRAVRFDAARRQILGEPVPIEERVLTLPPSGAAGFAVSRQGSLIFIPGTATGARRTLAWVTRDGREEPIPAEPRVYTYARLSPDGMHAALEARDAEQDIWILDFARKTTTKLTFDPALDAFPIWTHDGKRIIYQSGRAGAPNVFAQAADGTGAVDRITTADSAQGPHALTPDGKQLVIVETRPTTGPDIVLIALDRSSPPRTLIGTPAVEQNPDLSPDGRWLAYQSSDVGPPQIYVRPFPDVDGGKWQISTNGGSRPVWAKNGRELFYVDLTFAMIAVPIDTSNGFRPGNPVKLFDKTYYYSGVPHRPYDVSADGKRFLIIKDPEADQTASAPSIVMVLNWIEEVKSKLTLR